MAAKVPGVQREEVTDPLALTGREQLPERSLALQGIKQPSVGDPTGGFAKQANGLMQALSGVEKVVGEVFEKKKDEWITEGKTAYLSGKTEADIAASGNRYTQEGYNVLAARDKVNKWFSQEALNIEEAGKKMDPAQYQEFLGAKRKEVLSTITDPAAQKVAVAAFEELNPRLAQSQMAKQNEYQKQERMKQFTSTLNSTGQISATGSQPVKGSSLQVTPFSMAPIIKSSNEDRDAGIRTLIGEAGNQGEEGMAAVAHVIRNRATDKDKRWPDSIVGVVKEPKQFSVWNDGTGGTAKDLKPGDPIYEKAARVYDAVMQGKHVDPTGGATQYYSPSGMKAQGKANGRPDWADEKAKDGGEIAIGDHVFSGRTGKGFSGTGTLRFNNPQQDKLEPTFRSVLTDVSAGMGKELIISSGHRGANHPVEAAKAAPGEHSKGTAVDIDMTSMKDEDRINLVRQLRARGVMRFGTYSTMPNTLHIDMKDQAGDGTTHWMHDRTAANIGRAPAWMKTAASEPARSITEEPKQSGTQLQNFIRGSSALQGPEKAIAVADAMSRGLDADNPRTFIDGGGIAMLYDLGARPQDIDQVIKAKARYDEKQSNKFSIEKEQYRDDLLRRAEKGESRDSLFADIDQRLKDKKLDDREARALAQSAADKLRQQSGGEDSQMGNINMLNEIGGLYQRINTGSIKFEDAGNEVKAIAAKYGASEKNVTALVGQVFSLDQQYQNKLRNETAAAVEAKIKQDTSKAEVARALAKGSGLSQTDGAKIEILNAGGQNVLVTPAEYGVQQIREKWGKLYTDARDAGKIDSGTAAVEMERKIFLELQRHGVVDMKEQADMRGALQGNIMEKDGKLKPAAAAAYQTYLTWTQSQNASPAFIKKQIGDDEVYGLLSMAELLDAGDLSKEQALMKAYEIRSDPNRDPDARLEKTSIWRSKMESEVGKALVTKATAGFFEGLVYNDSKENVERIKTQNGVAERYVTQRAEAYHLQYPNEHFEVGLKRAIADLDSNSKLIAGNLIIAKPGFGIDKAMGVDGYGPKAADDAMKQFLSTMGPSLWPKQYGNSVTGIATDKKGESYLGAIKRGITDSNYSLTPLAQPVEQAKRAISGGDFSMLPTVAPRDPPVAITYNPQSGVVSIDMYKDFAKGQLLGSPKHFMVQDIGRAYIAEQNKPSTATKLFNSMFESLGKGIKDNRAEALAGGLTTGTAQPNGPANTGDVKPVAAEPKTPAPKGPSKDEEEIAAIRGTANKAGAAMEAAAKKN